LRTGSNAFATDASTNSSVAPASATMVAMLAAVDDGASGATAMPARSVPRNTAEYSMDIPAQTAIACPGLIPSR
jgi:hypothetical protein